MDNVIFEGYVAVTCAGARKHPNVPGFWKTTAKLSKGKPRLDSDSVAVKVRFELPASLFQEPALEAKITVPESAVSPAKIDMELCSNLEELIQKNTGFNVTVVNEGKEQS